MTMFETSHRLNYSAMPTIYIGKHLQQNFKGNGINKNSTFNVFMKYLLFTLQKYYKIPNKRANID